MTSVQDGNILKRKAREWAQRVVTLYNTSVRPEHEKEKQALLKRAQWIKEKIEALTGAIPELAPISETMGLGYIPIILGVVGVAAAGTLIVNWTLDYKKFIERSANEARLVDSLVSDGVSYRQAVTLARKQYSEPSFFDRIVSKENIGTLSLVGLGAFFFLYRKR